MLEIIESYVFGFLSSPWLFLFFGTMYFMAGWRMDKKDVGTGTIDRHAMLGVFCVAIAALLWKLG